MEPPFSRVEDEQLYVRFLSAETAEDLRRRFFAAVKHFNHAFIAPRTNVDYVKAMAFIAPDEAKGEIVGAARFTRLATQVPANTPFSFVRIGKVGGLAGS